MAPLLEARGLSVAYENLLALERVDLVVPEGSVVALLGPNGAGKSSTLDLLLGLRTPDSGSLSLFGTTPQRAIEDGRVGAMLQ